MNYLGLPREKVGQKIGEYMGRAYAISPEQEEWARRGGEAFAGFLPYEITPQEMGMLTQIGPVYHGSPHKFKKFKSEAIGTGQGAQSFGHGLYFSEMPDVATTYKHPTPSDIKDWYIKDIPLYQRERPVDYSPRVQTPSAHAKAILQENMFIEENKVVSAFDKSRKEGLKEIQRIYDDTIEQLSEEPWYHTEGGIDYLKSRRPETTKDIYMNLRKHPGTLYEATLHKGKKPGEYTYLEWDKGVPEDLYNYTISKLKEFGKEPSLPKNDAGGFYRVLAHRLGSAEEATRFLKNAGISGIKYPTGTLSGIKGSTKYNYVVFDPADITIESVK